MIQTALSKKRVQSIDVLRGIVMVIMALDHVRDYFHITAMTDDPLNLATTTPQLYFTRWITHFCAPVFVFLSGTSVYLVSLRKTKAALSSFLLKRGVWIIAVELIVVTFGWTFDPFYHALVLQVIWAIGISMFILGLLVWLPYEVIFVVGLLIVFGYNLLDYPEAARNGNVGFWWDLLHYGRFESHPINKDHFLLIIYPFVPWLGIMLLGYCFGKLYSPGAIPVLRQKLLVRMGFCLIVLFIIIRLLNHYGDPYAWSMQPGRPLYTFFSFMNVHKYPPSLLYTAITLGPAMIVLALLEGVENKLTAFFNVFGRVPMLYYILHLYLIHVICMALFFITGYTMNEAFGAWPFGFRPPDFGYSLWIVYFIWFVVIAILYPICKKYDQYKSSHQKWWLSYL